MLKKAETFSVLDVGLTMEGTLSCKGKMVIKGTVKGTLVGETVIIGQEGEVFADMKVGSLTVGGKFAGNIRAMEQLVILSTGNCEGKVMCKDLVIEPGGILNAEVTCFSVHPDAGSLKELPHHPVRELPRPPVKELPEPPETKETNSGKKSSKKAEAEKNGKAEN
jgi:cytoskeletal protein CcmA (bactofilin family)